jgi:hypothetical protein
MMCLAVCHKKLGGCGYLGDEREWTRAGQQCLCPKCLQDRMYFLFDYNVEEVVDASVMKSARNMLDEYYAKLNGLALRKAIDNGQIALYRLSQDQRKEIGI